MIFLYCYLCECSKRVIRNRNEIAAGLDRLPLTVGINGERRASFLLIPRSDRRLLRTLPGRRGNAAHGCFSPVGISRTSTLPTTLLRRTAVFSLASINFDVKPTLSPTNHRASVSGVEAIFCDQPVLSLMAGGSRGVLFADPGPVPTQNSAVVLSLPRHFQLSRSAQLALAIFPSSAEFRYMPDIGSTQHR